MINKKLRKYIMPFFLNISYGVYFEIFNRKNKLYGGMHNI